MYYFYILKNNKNILYKGISNNIGRRLKEHNKNYCIGTRGKGPWKLIYCREVSTRLDARKLEIYYKSGIGRDILNKLFK